MGLGAGKLAPITLNLKDIAMKKKLILVILLAIFMAFIANTASAELLVNKADRNRYDFRTFFNNYTASTAAELVVAISGKTFVVDRIVLSSLTPTSFFLGAAGSAVTPTFWTDTNGNKVITGNFLFGRGEGIDLTTDVLGRSNPSYSIWLEYHIEN